ncbi:MAG TPA: hypothetical protein VMF58_18330 [Rhizomicrobium sp.]|nr:hypothetical protein [Rhizomicrobium sp.]
MKHIFLTATAAFALVVSGMSAEAACGSQTRNTGSKTIKLPHEFFNRAGSQRNGSSIVGLWKVDYTAGGNPVYTGLEQWHSDGLEWEFADIPTITGDVCMGVWSGHGRKVNLYHTGWTFDSNGNPNGTMILTHEDKVSKDGESFSGTFDLKFFDSDGNLLQEVTGDDNGTRIDAP